MKLWQAALMGCDKRAKTVNACFRKRPNGECHSCFFGAAYEGTFNKIVLLSDGLVFDALREAYPEVFNAPASCPRCGFGHTIENAAVCLNDKHRWTRERIALEFVKPIEDRLEEERQNRGSGF